MKYMLLALLTIGLIGNSELQANNFQSCEGLYIGALGGANFHNSPPDNTGLIGGISLGFGSSNGFALEVEQTCRYTSVKVLGINYKTKTYSTMGNLYLNTDLGGWGPYLGAGCGYSFQNNEFKRNKKAVLAGRYKDLDLDKDHFTYQGIAGISHQVWYNGLISLEYRLLAHKDHISNQSVLVTVKQYF
jgi:opacity protein-like surface antigen